MYESENFEKTLYEGFEAVRYELGVVYDGERNTDKEFMRYYDEDLRKAAEHVHGQGKNPKNFEEKTERMLERFSD